MQINSLYNISAPYHREWKQEAQVAARGIPQEAVFMRMAAVFLHSSDRVRRRCPSGQHRVLQPNPSEDGFLCSLEHSKMSFQPLKKI